MNSHRRTAIAGRLARAVIAGLVPLVLTGCLAIPVDVPASNSRRNITDKAAADLRPGISTMEEVLLQLGEPDVISQDGRRLGYAWSRVKFIWIAGGNGSGAIGDVAKEEMLLLTFDENYRYLKSERSKHWNPSGVQTNDKPTI